MSVSIIVGETSKQALTLKTIEVINTRSAKLSLYLQVSTAVKLTAQ
jgi:hypothetical protein